MLNLSEACLKTEALINAGELHEAVEMCRSILGQDPNFAPGYFLMGSLFKMTGNFDKAVSFFDRAVRLNPQEPSFYVQLGHSMMCQGNHAAARSPLESALSMAPKDAMALLLMGHIAIQARDYNTAIAYLRRSLEVQPDPVAEEQLGLCLHLTGQLEEAELCCRRVVQMRPDYATGELSLAKVLMDRKLHADAERHFLRATELDSSLFEAWYFIARFHASRQEFKQAAQAALNGVNANPDDENLYRLLCDILLVAGQHAQAEGVYLQALQRFPKGIHFIEGYAKVLMQLGRLDEARPFIQKVLSVKPDDAVMRYYLDAIKGESAPVAPPEYVAKLFDEYADRFETHLQQGLGYATPDKLAEAVRGVLRADGREGQKLSLLDLGCGTGLGAEAMRDFTGPRTGVDLSSRMVQKALAKDLFDDAHTGDIVAFCRDSVRRFDCVLAADVLVYIGDLEPLFSAVRTTLAPAGLFVFSTEKNDGNAPWSLLTTARFAHSRTYLETLAREHGFTVRVMEETVIRQDRGHPVQGCVVVLQLAALH